MPQTTIRQIEYTVYTKFMEENSKKDIEIENDVNESKTITSQELHNITKYHPLFLQPSNIKENTVGDSYLSAMAAISVGYIPINGEDTVSIYF